MKINYLNPVHNRTRQKPKKNGWKAQAQNPQKEDANKTRGNEGDNQKQSINDEESRQSRSRFIQPVYLVIKTGRGIFENQLVKDGVTKRQCLEVALARSPKLYPDEERFWIDFRTERERLVDSKRFCKDCESLHMNPNEVADHIVFEGKGVVNSVLRDGLLLVMGDNIRMFNSALWKDKNGIFKKAEDPDAPAAEAKA
ncbi:MAG: hypothetical protein J6T67_05905 [Paludibacteraceae bacterium]|nr:hypothetical protein [Paludibacteraceae bacterium]